MSVIIRLQNLPWSANAADIRQFFHGLSIPEGGVHIVGGALGDAFIAFSTDEDARQGMASDGGLLKDSRVKLYLSSRTEMQKIIEETRQQHLAMQAAATGVPANTASVPRPFIGGPFAPVATAAAAAAPVAPAPVQRPASNNSNTNFHLHMDAASQGGHPGGYEHQMYQQQPSSHQPFNQSQRMMMSGPAHGGGFPPRMNQPQQQQQQYHHLAQGPPAQQHFGPAQHMNRGVEPGPMYGGQQQHGGPAGDMYGGGGPPERFDRDRRDSRDMPPEVALDRNRDMEPRGGGYRSSRDRGRRDRDGRDKDRGPDTGSRRGRRSRSRSGSRGRGRRRRSRSDSPRERSRTSRDRGGNGKQPPPGVGKSGLLPTPADQMENKSNETEAETSVQLRLLAGDLTYRDIRDYLNGIHVPNTCIKMINAFDGYRFGLAYIRFTSKVDKQKALSRHNGMIRGYPVQIFHVEDTTFGQAIDSFSPGISLDAKSLSNSCLSLRDFPPVATAQNVKDAFGTISIGQVLPERNESGTVTGLCYVELSSEADARKAIQLLKDGVMICGRQVKAAFLPLEELRACGRNLERLRGVVPAPLTDSPLSPTGQQPHRPPAGGGRPSSFGDRPNSRGNNGAAYDQPSNQRTGRPFASSQRVFVSGLPPTAMERDIGDFFSDVGVIPQMIEIVYDDERLPVGNAFCQFSSMQEAERALDKNGGFMGGHTVSVTLVESHHDAPPAPAVGDEPSHFNPYPDAPNVMNQSDRGPRGGGGYGHPGSNGPSYRPMGDGNGYNNPRFGGGGGPRFGGPRYPPGNNRGNNFIGGGGPRSRPPMNMRMRGGGPMQQQQQQNGGGRGGSDDGSPTPGFGAPGCVVALTNVPHKAIIADILDFFRGFQVNEKCVIRRFGHGGEPTGDARVAFPTPNEAELAVRTLQNEYLLNRRVVLSIL